MQFITLILVLFLQILKSVPKHILQAVLLLGKDKLKMKYYI